MKRIVVGILLMTFGIMLFAGGTTLFAVSAHEEQPADAEEAVSQVYEGEYYKDGDAAAEKIVLTDDELILADGTAAEYVLNVWKDMPETDEDSGRITYKDYCFLKLQNEKLSYDPASKTVVIDGEVYKML